MNEQSPDWLEALLSPASVAQYGYENVQGVLVQSKLRRPTGSLWGQSAFADRAKIPFTTTWCEQSLGERLLDKSLFGASFSRDDLVLDLGSGDGRYVKAMLGRGARRVVALNYELEPLLMLRANLGSDDSQRVALVCADISEHPFANDAADFIIAWGLWTSTADFRLAMDKTIDLLRVGGHLLNAEPILEHALLYALVMGDHEEFLRILKTKTRSLMWDMRDARYRVPTLHELRTLMAHAKLEGIWEDGISVMPSLLYGGLFSRTAASNELKADLWQTLQETPLGWSRQMVYFSRRRS